MMVLCKYCMTHIYTTTLLIVYLKLEFNWVPCVLLGNPIPEPGLPPPNSAQLLHSSKCSQTCFQQAVQDLASSPPWPAQPSGDRLHRCAVGEAVTCAGRCWCQTETHVWRVASSARPQHIPSQLSSSLALRSAAEGGLSTAPSPTCRLGLGGLWLWLWLGDAC